MKKNYQLMLDKVIENVTASGTRPRLLLHACCAPCSSYVLEYLHRYFEITLLFYNPNISPREEYDVRFEELKRLGAQMLPEEDMTVINGDYEPELFWNLAKGLEELREGGERCRRCYELRLSEAARVAAEGGFDYFTTTLSISPHKNAQWLNEIGERLSGEYGVAYLFSDFKKRGGYLRSCQLSEEYGLYRQDFCGCAFSRAQREKEKNNI